MTRLITPAEQRVLAGAQPPHRVAAVRAYHEAIEQRANQGLELAHALLDWLDNIDEDAPLDKVELIARRMVMKAEATE
jgi:hypothetical protein